MLENDTHTQVEELHKPVSVGRFSPPPEGPGEAVQEIISYRPHWMIRRGNVIFFSVILLLLALTLFIQYPDVVTGSARLVALNAPKTVAAHKEGKLIAIPVSSQQRVTKRQHLAYIESTADYKEVLGMNQWVTAAIERTRRGSFENLATTTLPSYYNLGELQTTYQSFGHEWGESKQFFGSGYYQKKKLSLQQDLAFNARLKANINQQQALTKQEQGLQKTEYDAYDSLAKEKLVAPMELNKYKSGLLGKEQTLAQTAAQLINNDVAAHSKQKELLDLQKQVLDQQQKLLTALLLLKSEAEKWMHQYVVIAPEDGTVFFITTIQPNEQVTAGQELFYIQPGASTYYAQLMAGQSGLGKVAEGQAVRLKVESYPSEEYGYVKGIVTSIASFPNRRDSFLVKVDLPNGLKTAYNKEIFFRNNLLARAEIITDDRKLFDRFFDPLKKLWK